MHGFKKNFQVFTFVFLDKKYSLNFLKLELYLSFAILIISLRVLFFKKQEDPILEYFLFLILFSLYVCIRIYLSFSLKNLKTSVINPVYVTNGITAVRICSLCITGGIGFVSIREKIIGRTFAETS